MSWKSFDNGRRAYFRNRRIDGRVVTEYFGSGWLAELASQEDEERRQKEKERRAAFLREQQFTESKLAESINLSSAVEQLVRASLLLAGMYRHQQGEWRKRPSATTDQGECPFLDDENGRE